MANAIFWQCSNSEKCANLQDNLCLLVSNAQVICLPYSARLLCNIQEIVSNSTHGGCECLLKFTSTSHITRHSPATPVLPSLFSLSSLYSNDHGVKNISCTALVSSQNFSALYLSVNCSRSGQKLIVYFSRKSGSALESLLQSWLALII